MLDLGKFFNYKTSGIYKQTESSGFSVRCYGSGGIHTTCSQATRFESILAKQETTNTTVVDGT